MSRYGGCGAARQAHSCIGVVGVFRGSCIVLRKKEIIWDGIRPLKEEDNGLWCLQQGRDRRQILEVLRGYRPCLAAS